MILIRMKLQIPQRRPEILRRQRLLDFLAEHQRHKLLLLCAPAGYGKSTLLTDYANDTNASICWYSLDEADRSPSVFLRYLTESIRLRFPDFGSHTQRMLETVSVEEGGDIGEQRMDAQLSEVMEVLLNDLYETVPRRFVVVLNDYHSVDNDSINTLMTKLLRYLPENGQIIILSREVPSLVLPQMAAQQEIAGLGTAELRFTIEETGAFLRQHWGQECSDQEIGTLVQRFDGWITGIILGTQALTNQFVSRLSGSDDTTQIFNYLAMEVLEQQRKDVQRFLLETSLLPRLSAPLCNALLGCQNAQEILYQIEAKGLFLKCIGSEKEEVDIEKLHATSKSLVNTKSSKEKTTWYRYHDFFRNFLYQRLQTQDPDFFHVLCRRVAELFLAEDKLEEAISYLLSAEEHEQVAQIIEVERHRFIEAEQLVLCERWLDVLPPEFIEHRPGLLFVRIRVLCHFGHSAEALKLAQQVEVLYEVQQDTTGQAEALLEQCAVLYWFGRHIEMISICHHAQELLSNPYPPHVVSQSPHARLLGAKIFRQLGVAFHHCGEARMAHEQFTCALAIYLDLDQMTDVAQVHENLALVLIALAEDNSAEEHLREVVQLSSFNNRYKVTKVVVMAYNNLAVLYGYQGRHQLALETLREAQGLLKQTSDTRTRAYLTATQADVLSNMGQGVQAEVTYAEAWKIAEPAYDTYLCFWLAQGRAENHLRRGELEQARGQIHKMQLFLPKEERGHAWGLFYLTCSHVARHRGDFLEALEDTRRAQELFRASQWRRAEIQTTVCMIGLLWKLKSAHEVMNVLATLLEQVDPARVSLSILHIFFCEERELLSVLLEFCKQPQGISEEQHERAQWLLRWLQRQESSDSGETMVGCYHEHRPALSVPNSAQLQIFALGEPRVYLGDTLITHWGSAKARELLLYFIASGTPLRKEVVMEALWPESLLPQADWLFRSTLHRLRQAIGQDYIVYQHGLYSLNLTYWYDVRDFRTALAQSQQLEIHYAQKHARPSEQILAAYRSTINLYGGDYCEPFYTDWCSQWRDELRQEYVGALIRLAQLSWETGLQDESFVLWRRLLSIDKCSEDAHQGLMIYYATNGQRVMVARQYQCCLEALEEFGMPPSPKTIALYQDATSPEKRVATL